MSAPAAPFNFASFVPGFDFLQGLTRQAGASAAPPLNHWIAPTLDPQELDKRIEELKAVQFWLDQNAAALKATIQALEVQKMSLATLRGMNLGMGEVARAFGASAAPKAAPAPNPFAASFASAPVPAPAAPAQAKPAAKTRRKRAAASAPAPGVVDPTQWWGSLTRQFQQIAASALPEGLPKGVPAAPDLIAKPPGPVRASAKKAAKKAVTPRAARKV